MRHEQRSRNRRTWKRSQGEGSEGCGAEEARLFDIELAQDAEPALMNTCDDPDSSVQELIDDVVDILSDAIEGSMLRLPPQRRCC